MREQFRSVRVGVWRLVTGLSWGGAGGWCGGVSGGGRRLALGLREVLCVVAGVVALPGVQGGGASIGFLCAVFLL